jgi:hypothetical protein
MGSIAGARGEGQSAYQGAPRRPVIRQRADDVADLLTRPHA